MKPDLKKVAFFAKIIGGAGLIVSFVYLTFQVSENTANVRAANTLAITNELNAFRKMRMASPKKARAG